MEPRIRYARTSDGADIAYGVAGNGPPLLIVRAMMRLAVDDELGPDSDAEWLAALAEHHTVVIWDPRGLGLSAGSSPEFTLDSSVRDLENVADAVQFDQFDLLGHLSLAHTALAYAAKHQTRVRRLALWNPSPPGGSGRQGAFGGLPDISRTHFLEYIQLAAIRTFGWERGRVARRWVDHMYRQFTPESWDQVMTQVEQLDSTQQLPGVIAPTLVIDDTSQGAGNRAETAGLYRKRLVAMLPSAELMTIKRGAKQTYTELVIRFLVADEEPADAEPSGTVIILFADIADHTAHTVRIGDVAFREKARPLDDALRNAVRDHGGTVIDGKTLGDGILATFPAASQAIAAAFTLEAAAATTGLGLHIGLHAGDVLREVDADGRSNVFGSAVSIASRISALAPPGEVFVSRTVADLARTSAGVTFEDRGEHALKGIAEPQRVFAVRASEGGS